MNLDPHQEAARLDLSEKVLLVAPPGSGKTTVLLAKIDYLVSEVGIRPERILVLTFSRSASDNMKARFQALRSGQSPIFGTLHAFAWRELRRRGGTLALITPGQAMGALGAIRTQYYLSGEEIHRLVGGISRERATGSCDETVPAKLRARVRAEYDAFKGKAGLVDFDDLEDELLSRLMSEGYRSQIQARFDWIMVDEFQDLNPKQIRILQLLSGKAKLFCVGDEDQCIYAFRGSDSTAMIHFSELFPGGRILYLVYNYRCSATITRHANLLIANNQSRYPKAIVNFRQAETQVAVQSPADESEQAEWILRDCEALPPRETLCIIARTNAEVADLAQRLIRRGIRCSLMERLVNPFDRACQRQAIGWLDYAMSRRPDPARFLGIRASLPVAFPPDVLRSLELSAHLTEADLLGDAFAASPECRAQLREFFRGMDRIRRMNPRAAIRYILYVLGYHRYLDGLVQRGSGDLRELIAEVESLANQAGEFPDLADFLTYIQTWDQLLARSGQPERILLATMHGVKGMEFDRVIIANACAGFIPHERAGEDLEAERRLCYVAVTRAKDELRILVPKRIQGRATTPSPFVAELEIPWSDPHRKQQSEMGRGVKGWLRSLHSYPGSSPSRKV